MKNVFLCLVVPKKSRIFAAEKVLKYEHQSYHR